MIDQWIVGANKVFQENIGDSAISSIGLDQKHVIRRPCVHIAIGNVSDISPGSQGPHAAATADIAIYIFDENIRGTGLVGTMLTRPNR